MDEQVAPWHAFARPRRCALLSGLLLLVLLSYLSWPLGGDATVHLTGVARADSFRDVVNAWTFRPLPYNLYLAALSGIATLLADFSAKPAFELSIKALHGVSIVAVLALVARELPVAELAGRRGAVVVAAFLAVGLLTHAPTLPLHAEEVAILPFLVAWALADRRGSVAIGLSAAIAAALPFFKGITVLMVVPLAVWVVFGPLTRRVKLIWLLTALLAALFYVAALVVLAPVAVRDVLDAAIQQGSLSRGLTERVAELPAALAGYMRNQPLILPGAAATAVVCVLQGRRSPRLPLFLVTCWGAALLAVLIQDKYFTYHFVFATVPAAVAIARCLTLRSAAVAGWALALTAGGAWLLATSPLAPLHEQTRLERARSVAAFSDVRTALEIHPAEEVLYLTFGRAPYFLGSPSACRHYFPIPLQRYDPVRNPRAAQTASFEENLQCVLAYEGRVVLIETDWFNLDDHPSIEEKIDAAYRLRGRFDVDGVTDRSFAVYERAPDARP